MVSVTLGAAGMTCHHLAGKNHGHDFVPGSRPGKVKALEILTAAHLQELQLFLLLDALGDHFHAQVVGHADNGGNDDGIVGVLVNSAHEGLIDLELPDGEFLEVGE